MLGVSAMFYLHERAIKENNVKISCWWIKDGSEYFGNFSWGYFDALKLTKIYAVTEGIYVSQRHPVDWWNCIFTKSIVTKSSYLQANRSWSIEGVRHLYARNLLRTRNLTNQQLRVRIRRRHQYHSSGGKNEARTKNQSKCTTSMVKMAYLWTKITSGMLHLLHNKGRGTVR